MTAQRAGKQTHSPSLGAASAALFSCHDAVRFNMNVLVDAHRIQFAHAQFFGVISGFAGFCFNVNARTAPTVIGTTRVRPVSKAVSFRTDSRKTDTVNSVPPMFSELRSMIFPASSGLVSWRSTSAAILHYSDMHNSIFRFSESSESRQNRLSSVFPPLIPGNTADIAGPCFMHQGHIDTFRFPLIPESDLLLNTF